MPAPTIWTDVEFRRVVAREFLAAAIGVCAVTIALIVGALVSLGILSKALLPVIVGLAVALGAVMADYVLQYRRAAVRVGLGPDSVSYEKRSGSRVLSGTVSFHQIDTIAVSPSPRGGIEIRPKRGDRVCLGPGLGHGSEFSSNLMKAVELWAAKNSWTVQMREVRVSRIFRYRLVELKEVSSAGG